MARWKLVSPHYLNVEGTKWEYQETDRKTGRPKRTQFPVPLFLDPRYPPDCNYRWGTHDEPEGVVIICYKGKGEPNDIEFTGDPTPDMIPLDDEAKTISASFEDFWKWKPDGAEVPFSQSLVDNFRAEMAEIQAKPTTVQVDGLSDLVSMMAAMTKANQELLASLSQSRRL